MCGEHTIQISGTAAMQSVDHEVRFGFRENVEANQLLEAFQIGTSKVDGFTLGPAVENRGKGKRRVLS